MQRKFKGLFLAVALATAAGVAAQDFVLNWNPRTGDAWVDTRLTDINQYGSRYRDPFIDEMVRYQAAPRDLVTDLLINKRWAPGDVYYACAIARVAGRPCREVVNEWENDSGQGWGAIAQRMGIKPGSAQFHALKRGIVPTYDRWGRPIAIDADMRKAFPNRGHDQKAKVGQASRSKSVAVKSDHGKPIKHAKSGPAVGKADKGRSTGKGNNADKGKGGKGKSGKGNGKP